MNLKVKILFFIIFVLIEGLSPYEKKYSPDNKKVESALEEIEKEITTQYKTLNFIEYFIEKIFNQLKNSASIIKILLILFFIFITIYLIFILLKNILKKKRYRLDIIKKRDDYFFDEKFLKELIKENKFSEAIVYMYNFLIKLFKKNNFIYNYNITNNEIYKRLNDKEIADSFKKIYHVSEKILFNNYSSNYNDFNYCYDIFKNTISKI